MAVVVEVVESGTMDRGVSKLVTDDVFDPIPGSLDSLLKVGLKVLEAEAVTGEPWVLSGYSVAIDKAVYVRKGV